jgi:hypothetical protein
MKVSRSSSEVDLVPVNFHYAAHRYVNDWLGWDKKFHAALSPAGCSGIAVESGAKTLVKVASYYTVIRTLPVTGEPIRLGAAYSALLGIREVPAPELHLIVENYANMLKATYGLNALSAASKFLWVRFRDPVVIYDSIASSWLSKNSTFHYNGYRAYVDAWSDSYQKAEGQIREACDDLRQMKKFILCDVSDAELSECTSSKWFMGRVFDYSMIYLPE